MTVIIFARLNSGYKYTKLEKNEENLFSGKEVLSKNEAKTTPPKKKPATSEPAPDVAYSVSASTNPPRM